MPLWQALILGIVQGLTEFLPISSSGHLALFQALFRIKEPMLTFDVALHAGTLLALVIYFYKELRGILRGFGESAKQCLTRKTAVRDSAAGDPWLWLKILLTMVPTGLIALLFKDYFESAFSDIVSVGWQFVVMGIFLIASVKIPEGTRKLDNIGWGHSFWIGAAQALALIPAISRSGATILAGMGLGIKKEDAARFSFLISIPAIAAAVLLEMKYGAVYFASHEIEILAGFLASAVSGYAVIKWLMGVIQRGRFSMFGYYCLAAGLISFAVAHYWR